MLSKEKGEGAWSKVVLEYGVGAFWDSILLLFEEVSSERLHAFGDTCFSGINARDQTQQLGSTVASTYQEKYFSVNWVSSVLTLGGWKKTVLGT